MKRVIESDFDVIFKAGIMLLIGRLIYEKGRSDGIQQLLFSRKR